MYLHFHFTKIRWKITELLGSKVLAETPCIRVKNKLLPKIRTFREITFFTLCVTRIVKSDFECPTLYTYIIESK
jgi:hypothetical protein